MNFRRRIIRGDYAKPSAFDLMADIFVNYAKADRPLALKLAAMLEAEGWTTWWDTSLTIGDDFRNEIMTELVAPAKAVSRRLIFLALGLLLLIGLNELSKLGLDVTAPKLQGLIH